MLACDPAELDELFPRPDPAIFPTLTGRQAPHHLSVFAGDERHGRAAVTLAGRLSRDPFMPWQCGHLRAIMRQTVDGMWTHGDAVLLCPRQNGKSEILLFRCLYGLAVLAEKILYTVQRWDTGRDLHERMVAIIESSASLRARLARKPTLSQGRGTIVFRNGAKMVISTRSADVGRGLTKIDLLIYDEAYNLDSATSAAVDYAQMASSNPQTIYTSTAVYAPHHPKGFVLTDMRAAGLAGAAGIYFAEHMAPRSMPHDAIATWQYGNPSYGIIQTAAKVLKLLRKATTAAGVTIFGVEALGRGVWPVRDEDRPALIPSDVWARMRDPRPRLVGHRAVAFDMTPDRSTLTVSAAQWTAGDRVHLDIGYHGPATQLAVPYIAGLVGRMDPRALIVDRASPAASYVQELINAGIDPTLTDTPEMAQATGDFYDKSMARLLNHTGDPVLADAVEGAIKRDLPGGGWAWDRRGANVISPVVAGTLATWGLLRFGTRAPVEQTVVTRRDAAPARSRPGAGRTHTGAVDFATAGF